jgi:hypothetical protein
MALEYMYNTRISRNQQDSQEFLHLIHEAVSLEDTRIKKAHPDNEKLIIPTNPFEGEVSTQIQCQRCGFTTPWKKEAFTELSVAVPSKVPSQVAYCSGVAPYSNVLHPSSPQIQFQIMHVLYALSKILY